eukprot:944350-Pelagomonas_calceolata.AAC.3
MSSAPAVLSRVLSASGSNRCVGADLMLSAFFPCCMHVAVVQTLQTWKPVNREWPDSPGG